MLRVKPDQVYYGPRAATLDETLASLAVIREPASRGPDAPG